jgi:hypothetical protein
MIFNAFQRDDDDAVFTIVRNVSGATLNVGESCVWDVSASADGVRVSQAAATTLSLFRGIVVESIADSAYGKVQVHGFFTDASVINDTSVTHQAGTVLKAVASADYLEDAVETGVGTEGFVYALEAFATDTTPAASTKNVLIRAL